MAGSAATLKIEYGPAEYGAELADFAAAAFEPKDGHRGRHIIERRRAGGWEFETVATCYIDELPAVLSALEIEPGFDYYIPGNTFSGCRRTREQLFALNNIVIDIDAHNMTDRRARCALLEKFAATLLAELRPLPGFIVFTGRGVQLWYPIEQESYKAAPRYIVVREYIIKQVEEIRRRPEFAALTLDAAASRNLVSPYRLPLTENTKTAGETPDGAPIRGHVQWIHDNRLRLSHEEKRIAAEYGRSKEEIEHGVIKMPRRRHILAAELAAQLIALPGIRAAAGVSLKGMRNQYFYHLIASLQDAGWARDKIGDEVRRINDTLDEPLKAGELESCLRSCYRKEDRDGAPYPTRPEGIISKLQITAEEARQLALYVEPGTKREKEKARRRKKKAARNDQILELYRQGHTATEAAAAAKCSLSTASRVISAAGIQAPADLLRANICHLRQAGHTITEIAEITGVTKRTVYNHLRKAREAGEISATDGAKDPAGVFIDRAAENATEAKTGGQDPEPMKRAAREAGQDPATAAAAGAEIWPQSAAKDPAGVFIDQQAETCTAATAATQAATNEEGQQQGPAEPPAFICVSAAREAAPEWIPAAVKCRGERPCKNSTYTRRGNARPGPRPCINIHPAENSGHQLREKIEHRRPILTAEETAERQKLIEHMRRNREKWAAQGLESLPLPWPAREDPDRLRE